MSEPHHHVFNALQREIYRSVQLNPLLSILKERHVINHEQAQMCKSKSGIKILVGQFRNRDFDAFLGLIECICIAHESPEGAGKIEKPIVMSMRSAVADYDAKHKQNNVAQVDRIINKYKKIATFMDEPAEQPALAETSPTAEAWEPATEAAASSGTTVPSLDLTEMDLSLPTLPYIGEPVTLSLSDKEAVHYFEELDLSLHVPMGTVPSGAELKLRIGACCYGPFSIAEKYLVVTSFYCIASSLRLMKPVQITMGHCLQMPQYQRSRSVVVLRAAHQTVSGSDRHDFEPLCHPEISSDEPYLSFEVSDFCILCGVLESKPEERASQEATTSVSPSEDMSPTNQGSFIQSNEEAPNSAEVVDPETKGTDTGLEIASENLQSTISEQRKRKHSPQCESSSKRVCRVESVEYAVLLYEPRKRSMPSFFLSIYVCQYCTVAIKECERQAREDQKVLVSSLQVTFKDSRIEFVPCKNNGLDVISRKTPVVREEEVHPHLVHHDLAKLRGLTEVKVYPPRIDFVAFVCSQAGGIKTCDIAIQGVNCDYSHPVYFRVIVPAEPPSVPQELPTPSPPTRSHSSHLIRQESLKLDEYMNQLSDEQRAMKVTRKIILRTSHYIRNWEMAGRTLGLTDATVSQISYDHSPHGALECAYRMLSRWMMESVTVVIIEDLMTNLYEAREYEAIRKIIEFIKETGEPVVCPRES